MSEQGAVFIEHTNHLRAKLGLCLVLNAITVPYWDFLMWLLLGYYTRLTAFFQDNLGKPVPER